MGEGSKYVTVKNCEIYNIGLKYNLPKDHGIYIGYGADHLTFSRIVFMTIPVPVYRCPVPLTEAGIP